ncbi:MAG: PAS domain S-box protein [Salinimicrobium sp.]
MSLLHTNAEFQKLLKTKELYKQIFNCSILPVIIHDMFLNIIDVNDKAQEVFGYSKEEMLELQVLDLHTKAEYDHSLEVLEEMQHKDNLSAKSFFKRKDGAVFSAEVSPCKISLQRAAFIHVHFQNVKFLD